MITAVPPAEPPELVSPLSWLADPDSMTVAERQEAYHRLLDEGYLAQVERLQALVNGLASGSTTAYTAEGLPPIPARQSHVSTR